MLLLLLMGASFGVGLSYDSYNELDYGTTYKMLLHRNAQYIAFRPEYDSNAVILWERNNPSASDNSRQKVMGSYYVISNLTQRDSGHYIIRDSAQNILSTRTIVVVASTKSDAVSTGKEFSFTFDLEPKFCNIYFFPKSDSEVRNDIVHQGRLQKSLDESDCSGFELLKPCGISNKAIQRSCSGHFEVRDQNGDKALVVMLHVETKHYDPSYLAIAIAACLAALFCCCCVKCCCCGKRSSENDDSKTSAARPAMHHHAYDGEPARTHYPAQPSYTPTGPLIHHPPAVNMPPAFEISAPAEKEDAPTVPLCSDHEPRFEVKGLTSTLPLSSDSGFCDVYTSDKLNYL
ncbi:uncharacterized protein LOC113143987 [Mastacembelus armatus]|uniref:uncharacterized protein LOC113143987 n=1 Tax=Mastacembelus armatus TaxID=205130 RepID=UPI000E464C03|nr:uncharacterized protein LOC113143987 [Mastacembelus armatus]